MSLPPVPRVSCVVPVFNGKAFLAAAVESVLGQGDAVQLVLVDDGSTDGSLEMVLEAARRDPRVLALSFPPGCGRGQGNARNVGVAAATAPYVTVLDQDDEHVPGWYDVAADLLDASPGSAAVRGGVELKGLPPGLDLAPDDPRMASIVASVMWNYVVRKVAYQAVGGCPPLHHYGEDVAFLAALRKHFLVADTDYPACVHYVRPGGSTAKFFERTRVVDGRLEFLEVTRTESDGTLQAKLEAHWTRADASVAALRALLRG